MGVMACSRNKCENIMCDTYIDDIGYICSDCQNEFKDFLKSKSLFEIIGEGVLRTELKIFMNSEKDLYKGNEMGVDEFFRIHTRV